MSAYTAEELTEARRSIDSTLHKCEKALLKLTPGKSQYTLTARRIKAFQVALTLIDRELKVVEICQSAVPECEASDSL